MLRNVARPAVPPNGGGPTSRPLPAQPAWRPDQPVNRFRHVGACFFRAAVATMPRRLPLAARENFGSRERGLRSPWWPGSQMRRPPAVHVQQRICRRRYRNRIVVRHDSSPAHDGSRARFAIVRRRTARALIDAFATAGIAHRVSTRGNGRPRHPGHQRPARKTSASTRNAARHRPSPAPLRAPGPLPRLVLRDTTKPAFF